MRALRADVADVEHPPGSDFALHRQVPLLRARRQKMKWRFECDQVLAVSAEYGSLCGVRCRSASRVVHESLEYPELRSERGADHAGRRKIRKRRQIGEAPWRSGSETSRQER